MRKGVTRDGPGGPAENRVEQPGVGARHEEESDRALNFLPDQVPDIQRRLRKVSLEWDLERTLEVLQPFSLLALGTGLFFMVRRRYRLGAVVVGGFFLQEAVKRWRRPAPLLRHLGVRDKREIELERYALKVQRGDFGKLEVIPFR